MNEAIIAGVAAGLAVVLAGVLALRRATASMRTRLMEASLTLALANRGLGEASETVASLRAALRRAQAVVEAARAIEEPQVPGPARAAHGALRRALAAHDAAGRALH